MENMWKFRGYDATGQLGWVYGDLVRKIIVGGYEVEPESVGMFTGIMDSKGTEIYQGDIIKISYNGKVVYDAPVIWHKDYAAFLMSDGDNCYSPIPNVAMMTEITVEVIGNVFTKDKNLAK